MKKQYKINYIETVNYSVIIEAENEEQAIFKAQDLWGTNGPDAFKLEDVMESGVSDIELLKTTKEVA